MIRSLRPGEAVPSGTPRRYPNSNGYIRLRWKVGVAQYVETYEHRTIDGRVTTAEHVHHRNGLRDDNRPENLAETSLADHLTHHGEANRTWPRDEAAELYAKGWTTTDLGKRYGTHAAVISRGLRAAGVEMRPASSPQYDLDCEVLALHYEEGLRAQSIAERLGVSDTPVRRILRKYGITFRAGRPGGYVEAPERAS